MVSLIGARLAPLDLGEPWALLTYNGVPLFDAVSSQVISLSVTDNIEGQADEIDLTVHNADGKWFLAWSPEHGDRIEGALGYKGGVMVPIGTFFVDRPSARGGRGGDIFSTAGQSAPTTKPIRTKKTRAFEKQKLKQVADKVAGEHGMSVVGTPPDITFDRITQRRETDLGFLRRVFEDFGSFFKVAGTKIVVSSRDEVWARAPVRTFTRGDREIKSYGFSYNAGRTFSKAQVNYFDGKSKKKITGKAEDKKVKSGDTLKLDDRVENEGQANKLAKSRLDKANMKQWQGSFEVVGDPLLLAGQIVAVAGYGRFDRRYTIMRARHRITRAGYVTHVELQGVRE